VLLFAAGLPSTSAFALITNITVSPANTNVPLGGSAAVTVTWTVFIASTTSFSSPGGTVRDDTGNIYGTNSNAIYKTFPLSTAAVPVSVTETFIIPANVIDKAYKAGKTNFFYSRNFTDVNGSSSWSVTLYIASSSLSGFSISGESLSFDDHSVLRMAHLSEKLTANAEINYTGTGLLQAVWEVADPVSTQAQPIFRPLMHVRRYLAGSGKQTITSPELPTTMSGLYLLRLRITEPQSGFEQPSLRYFVSSGKPGEKLPIQPIGVLMPVSRTLLAPDTLFAWQPLPGAFAYQLELYARAMTEADKLPDLGGDSGPVSQVLPKTPAAAGIQITANKTHTTLPATTLSHLKPGHIYLWRVVAIDKKGRTIGVSSIREIRLP